MCHYVKLPITLPLPFPQAVEGQVENPHGASFVRGFPILRAFTRTLSDVMARCLGETVLSWSFVSRVLKALQAVKLVHRACGIVLYEEQKNLPLNIL